MSNRVKKSSRLQTIDSNELVIASKRFCSELHLTARLSSASGPLRNFQELSSYKRATNSKKTQGAFWMKNYWIVLIAGLLSLGAAAQTGAGAGASASGNTSVSAGQSGANANANADANAKADAKHGSKQANGSASGNGSGSASASTNSVASALGSGTNIQAELTKSLDAKKAKAGDEVTAKVTQDVRSNGQVVIHKGSRLIGHVTEAKARSKEDSESRLGLAFDRAVLKNGEQVALGAAVQALAPPASAAASAVNSDSLGVGGGMPAGGGAARSGEGGGTLGGVAGGATSTVGSTVGAAGNTAGSVTNSTTGSVGSTVGGATGTAANGALNSTSHGVVGMQGVNLSSATSGNATASVLSSTTQNVKLDSGTQMLLQVQK